MVYTGLYIHIYIYSYIYILYIYIFLYIYMYTCIYHTNQLHVGRYEIYHTWILWEWKVGSNEDAYVFFLGGAMPHDGGATTDCRW